MTYEKINHSSQQARACNIEKNSTRSYQSLELRSHHDAPTMHAMGASVVVGLACLRSTVDVRILPFGSDATVDDLLDYLYCSLL
jgi:hypothetical protein